MAFPRINRLKLIRNGLHDAIQANRNAEEYILNEFELKKGYRAQQKLEALTSDGCLTVVALATDEARVLRSQAREAEYQVQFGLQARVGANVDEGDDLLLLWEQIFETCASDQLVSGHNFSFQKTEALRDANGLPYNLNLLREASTFEMVATAFYKLIIEPAEDED